MLVLSIPNHANMQFIVKHVYGIIAMSFLLEEFMHKGVATARLG